jgi:RNA recognition motif-containing protein
LNTLFRRFGSIANVSLKSGSGECYGFVNFHSNSCAHEAVDEMNGKVFHGKRINCKVQVEENRSPSVGEYTVKVTSVSKNTTEVTLVEVFGFGNPNCVQSVRMVPCSPGFIYNYAYVNYFYARDAERAVAELDQRRVDGCAVRVKLHSGQVGSPSADAPMHRVASYSGGHAPAVVPQPGSPSLPTQRHMSRAISQPAFGGFSQQHSGSPTRANVPPRNVYLPPGTERVINVPPGRNPASTVGHPTCVSPNGTVYHLSFGGSNTAGPRQQFRHSGSLTGANQQVQRMSAPPMRQSSDPVPAARFAPYLPGSRALSYPGVSSLPPQTHPAANGSDLRSDKRSSPPVMPAARAASSMQQSNTIKVSMHGVLSSEDIEEVFSRFGTIRGKPIIREGNPCYVFVNFSTPKAAGDACSLHNSTVKGINILVKTHNSQRQQPGVNLEPREVGCTSLAASILSSKHRKELENLETQHQVRVAPKHDCIKVWGPREQVSAVELCLQSLLERVEGEVSVKVCELPCHSVPLFGQDSAVEEVRKIEAARGVEFRVLRAAPDATPVDLASFCRDVKQVFVPAERGTSTAVPTCSELDSYLTEKPGASPPPTETATTTWLWQNDSGSGYISFTRDISAKLNGAFLDDPTGSLTLKIGAYEYSIDFSTMTQTNTRSGRSRPIQQATGGSQRVQWFYVDDRKQFVPYTTEQSDEIEQMYQLNDVASLIINAKAYRLDFTNMNQCNAATLNSRKIERRVTLGSDGEDIVPSVERVLTLQAAGLPESLEPSIEELRGIVERSTIQKECRLNRESSKSFKAQLMKNMNKYFVTAELVDDCLKLKGTSHHVERVHLIAEQEKLSNREQMMDGLGGEFKPPAHWRHQTEEVVLDVVKPNSEEWKTEVGKIHKTLRGATVVKLERVQNKWLWERYSFSKRRMLKTNRGLVNEKHLFHGTRKTEPEKVFRSEKGVDFRFSREGLWGTGSYFAVNALYSDAFAYVTPGGINEKQMFVCKVLTGDSYNAETNTDKSLRQPPLKPAQRTSSFEERYDSVKGFTNGSYVYVVYDHEKVYPAYLVTYRKYM